MKLHDDVQRQVQEIRWRGGCEVYPIASFGDEQGVLALVVPKHGKNKEPVNSFKFEDDLMGRLQDISNLCVEDIDWSEVSDRPYLIVVSPRKAQAAEPEHAA